MDQSRQLSGRLSSLYTSDEQLPACVYLFGQKSVGKTLCIQKFIHSHRDWLQSIVVRAEECYTSKILFETVINAFNNHEPSEENDYSPHSKTDLMEDFLLQLSLLDLESSYLIVIDSAEKLLDMELNILPVLMKLQEFTELNISCILISHIALENIDGNAIIKINVPDYSKSELVEIFVSNYQDIQKKIIEGIHKCESAELKEKQLSICERLDEVFYRNYLNIFLSFFFKACRDITELQSLASKCYPAYYAPVLSGEIQHNDVSNLWRNIQKVLTITLQTSHMRIENLSAKDMINVEASTESVRENSIKGFAQSLELPYYAKYLLIASFLASHNDAKFDKRLYMKHHGKERKRQKMAKVCWNDLQFKKFFNLFLFRCLRR